MNNSLTSHRRSESNGTSKNSKVVIDGRYLLKQLIAKKPQYNMYEAIDLVSPRYVYVYAKSSTVEQPFSRKIKQELKGKLSPQVLWSGIYKIDKVSYFIEIHDKFGPSLYKMFQVVKNPISESSCLHLLYQMLRLVEKCTNAGYVVRQFDLDHIVFDLKPQKTELHLLNTIPLKKKSQPCAALNTRFCSRGAHLGLSANSKDDLESICYILMSIYTQGDFISGISSNQYEEYKTSLDITKLSRKLPIIFVDFYKYVLSLNYHDEINFFHWKNVLTKLVCKQVLSSPYSWMIDKQVLRSTSFIKLDQTQEEIILENTEQKNKIADDLDQLEQFNANCSKFVQLTNKYTSKIPNFSRQK